MAVASARGEVSIESLLQEMTNFSAVASWPPPKFTGKQARLFGATTWQPSPLAGKNKPELTSSRLACRPPDYFGFNDTSRNFVKFNSMKLAKCAFGNMLVLLATFQKVRHVSQKWIRKEKRIKPKKALKR